MAQGDDLAFEFLVRLRGGAEPFAAVRNVAHHPGLRADGDLIADLQMAADARRYLSPTILCLPLAFWFCKSIRTKIK